MQEMRERGCVLGHLHVVLLIQLGRDVRRGFMGGRRGITVHLLGIMQDNRE